MLYLANGWAQAAAVPPEAPSQPGRLARDDHLIPTVYSQTLLWSVCFLVVDVFVLIRDHMTPTVVKCHFGSVPRDVWVVPEVRNGFSFLVDCQLKSFGDVFKQSLLHIKEPRLKVNAVRVIIVS